MADAALEALADIADRGGGTVEGDPKEADDRTVSGSFLTTRTLVDADSFFAMSKFNRHKR